MKPSNIILIVMLSVTTLLCLIFIPGDFLDRLYFTFFFLLFELAMFFKYKRLFKVK